MVVFPGCKINIGLNVTGKREDGYHNLESVFYPLPLSDILEIIKSDEFEIRMTGLAINGNESDNLVVKACKLLEQEYALSPVKIHLHKVVPMGAGLGGGSADGAATLLLLNNLFDLGLSTATLEAYAGQLGSDCSFFIRNAPAFVKGKGEQIHPIDTRLSDYYIQLVNPGIHISTKEAFQNVSIRENGPDLAKTIVEKLPKEWGSLGVYNGFEKGISERHAAILAIKEKLLENGAEYAAMTGSGSTVYGLFKKKPAACFPHYFEWISSL